MSGFLIGEWIREEINDTESRLLVVGNLSDGRLVVQVNAAGALRVVDEQSERAFWTVLMDCDSWDWVEPPLAPAPIDPGEGYRLLAKNEIVISGDEYFCPTDRSWETSNNWGESGKQSKLFSYRRKVEPIPASVAVDPGEGYRLLAPEELVIDGDDFLSKYTGWEKSANHRGFRRQSHLSVYRRKVEPAPASKVIDVDPGKGYRWLEPHELPIEGDEFFHVSSGWRKSHNWIDGCPQADGLCYRRRVEPLRTQVRFWCRGSASGMSGFRGVVVSVENPGDCIEVKSDGSGGWFIEEGSNDG